MEVEDNLSVGMLEIKDIVVQEDWDVLDAGLTANAVAHGVTPIKKIPLSIIKHDEDGSVLAGLIAHTGWGWLHVDRLWVCEDLRGQGIGSALLVAAEEEALKRGCHSASLWTQDYEGLNFYPKVGYEKRLVCEDHPVGSDKIVFTKRLRDCSCP